jgi:uncharacterized protein YndB with AHSA1/START domain
MTTTAAIPTRVTTQIYRVYIKATPSAIWNAITKPEWTERYGYGGRAEFDLRPGGAYKHFGSPEMRAMGAPEIVIDGEIIESDPPRKLVYTWRMLMDEHTAGEGFTRLTWEIDPGKDGVARLTVIHELEGAPRLAALVGGELADTGAGGGWSWILSDLKTLLETGKKLAD